MACSGARTHFKSIYIIPDLKSRYIVITPEQATTQKLIYNSLNQLLGYYSFYNKIYIILISV